MNVEYFCIISGVSESNRLNLIKKYGNSKKAYSEWFELLEKNFTIPKNMDKFFKQKQVSKKESAEEIVQKLKSKKKSLK